MQDVVCPSSFCLCVCVCVCSAAGVSSDKRIKVLGCLSLPLPSVLFLSFFSDSALARSHWGIRVTLTGTRQDTALRQKDGLGHGDVPSQHNASQPFLPVLAPLFPYLHQSAARDPALTQDGVRRKHTHTHKGKCDTCGASPKRPV